MKNVIRKVSASPSSNIVYAGVALLCLVLMDFFLPHRHLPWRPLVLDEPIGLATGFKLSMLKYLPDSWCNELLSQATTLEYVALAPRRGDKGCGWESAYQLQKSSAVMLAGKAETPMRCAIAAASHIWMRDINQLAQQHFNTGLRRVNHVGSYSCRRMYNRNTGPMSEHAYANAWDVTGFELGDGSIVSIKKHWNVAGKQDFLNAVRSSACRLFNVVLSPDYNAAHHDHLHLDMGQSISCR